MKKLIYILGVFLTLFIFSCKKSTTSTDPNCTQGVRDSTRICPTFYNPVCGCNKKTYDNECEALKDGITTYTAGKCP